MKNVSLDQLYELGELFDISLDDSETEFLQSKINEVLNDLGSIDIISERKNHTTHGNRKWNEIDNRENPNNAIITECHVPPKNKGSLSGYKVGIKDNIAVAGVPLTCASSIFRDYTPNFDATVVERLLKEGATITAKTNCDEMGTLGLGTNGYLGPITNPVDQQRVAGGSSGGSAAAVVNNLVDVAIGTDTGGSIRLPACFCGLVGLKPTNGLVPQSGFVKNTVLFDTIGPITSSVSDAALVLEAIVGKDKADPINMQAAGRDSYQIGGYMDTVENPPDISKLRIGIINEGFDKATQKEVGNVVRDRIEEIQAAGASITPVSIPHFHQGSDIMSALNYTAAAVAWFYGTIPYNHDGDGLNRELFTNLLRRIKQSGSEINTLLKLKLLVGAYMLEYDFGHHYLRGRNGTDILRDEFEKALSKVDLLALPTMTTPAPKIEECPEYITDFDYGQNIRHANLTRLPAISIPAGKVNKLPVGLQLIGSSFDEKVLLGFATQIESIIFE